MLEIKGFDVQQLSAGNTVLDVVEHKMPGIVLLDILLGKYDGMDICKSIKEIPIPVKCPY